MDNEAFQLKLRTVFPDEDVEHGQNLSVVRNECLADQSRAVARLRGGLARDHELEDVQGLDDDPGISSVERVCRESSEHKQLETSNTRYGSLLIGMISCGITGSALELALINMSFVPCSARNAYGSSTSRSPSKKIGR